MDGQAIAADSNIGVGHEAYVIQTLINEYGVDTTLIYDKTKEEMAAKLAEHGMEQHEIDLVVGYFFDLDTIDPRDFAMESWGWKRLVDSNIQTWTLTASDLKSMGTGILDAYGDMSDDALYDLYVDGSGKMYKGIPLYVFEDGQPNAMRNYQSMNVGGIY